MSAVTNPGLRARSHVATRTVYPSSHSVSTHLGWSRGAQSPMNPLKPLSLDLRGHFI